MLHPAPPPLIVNGRGDDRGWLITYCAIRSCLNRHAQLRTMPRSMDFGLTASATSGLRKQEDANQCRI
jgi:hypothetical protein